MEKTREQWGKINATDVAYNAIPSAIAFLIGNAQTDIAELYMQIDKLADDYRARGLALQAAKAMQAGETERADKAEARFTAERAAYLQERNKCDQLADALEILDRELVNDPTVKPNGSIMDALRNVRAALAAVKGE